MGWYDIARSNIGESLYGIRNAFRKAVPQKVRQVGMYGSPLYWGYKGAQALGTGQWLGKAYAAEPTNYQNQVGPFTKAPAGGWGTVAGDSTTNTGGSGYSTGSGTATAPTYAWWGGTRYNINNPNEAAAYTNARRAFIEENYGYGMQQAEKGVTGQLEDWKTNYLKTLEDLGKTKEKRDVGIAAYFSAIAPNMYQSAEEENLKESLRLLTEGQTEAGRQKKKTETTLTDWWENYKRTAQQNRQTELDALAEALTSSESASTRQRIAGMFAPTVPTTSALNISDYFNRLGQPIGAAPAATAQTQQPANATVNNIIAKISAGLTLTPEEQALAVQYGI